MVGGGGVGGGEGGWGGGGVGGELSRLLQYHLKSSRQAAHDLSILDPQRRSGAERARV